MLYSHLQWPFPLWVVCLPSYDYNDNSLAIWQPQMENCQKVCIRGILTWQCHSDEAKSVFQFYLVAHPSIYLLLLWWCLSGGHHRLWYTILTYKMHDWMRQTEITFKVSTSFVSTGRLCRLTMNRAQSNLAPPSKRKLICTTIVQNNWKRALIAAVGNHHEWIEIWQSAINNKQQIALESIEERDRKEVWKRAR